MNPQFIKTTAHYNPNPTRSRIFTVKFFSSLIRTVVTPTPAIARQWVYDLRHNHGREISKRTLVVGLGVQWRANFTTANPITAATLQLCVGTDCLVFQVHHASTVPATLRNLLTDDRITFVGVHNRADRRALSNSRHKLAVQNLVDLSRNYPRLSMQDMASRFLGFHNVVKPSELGLSNWEAFVLSKDQIQFACVDALVSYLLARALRDDHRRILSSNYIDYDNNHSRNVAEIPSVWCRDDDFWTSFWFADGEQNKDIWFADDDDDAKNKKEVADIWSSSSYADDDQNKNKDIWYDTDDEQNRNKNKNKNIWYDTDDDIWYAADDDRPKKDIWNAAAHDQKKEVEDIWSSSWYLDNDDQYRDIWYNDDGQNSYILENSCGLVVSSHRDDDDRKQVRNSLEISSVWL